MYQSTALIYPAECGVPRKPKQEIKRNVNEDLTALILAKTKETVSRDQLKAMKVRSLIIG
jgi:hypothetical protein